MGKRAWQTAGFVAGVWVVAYAGFWLHASGCFRTFSRVCNYAPYEPIRAFVMLDWVWGYQTLLGGMLAFSGGAFVYLAARMQRQDQVADRYAAVRELRFAQMIEARRLLFAMGGTIRYLYIKPTLLPGQRMPISPSVYAALSDYLAELRPVTAAIGSFAPMLAQVIGAISERVRVTLEDASRPHAKIDNTMTLTAALGTAGTAATFLLNVERLLAPDGTYRHIEVTWDRPEGEIDPILRSLFRRP